MQQLRVLFVQPASFEPGRLGLENTTWLSEPVAFTSLAAMIPEHSIRILDMRLEPDIEFNNTLNTFEPHIICTTSMTTDCYHAKALLHCAKTTLGDSCFTIVGGHHPTLSPEEFEDDMIDAICIGEGELTFKEIVDHLSAGKPSTELYEINGLRFRDRSGNFKITSRRSQEKNLDEFPAPARHYLKKYSQEYFFCVANPMGSIMTSRGCSFDCNFCAIWEFYERKTRFMSAKTICDRLETMPEKFIFFLDDNFLTNQKRLEDLCDEIKKRRIRKFWGIQGRSDFIADHPDMIKKLRNAGLSLVLSGYESNDDNALEALRKNNTLTKNIRASEILRKNGIISTGVFMVRPDFEEKDFDLLYQTINEMGIAISLITILTPLPGTQLFKKRQKDLLTEDKRLFDLLHVVLPTKISRERFYRKFSENNQATWPGFKKGIFSAVVNNPRFALATVPSIRRFLNKTKNYRSILESHESHLRDEIGIIHPNITLNSIRTMNPFNIPIINNNVMKGVSL